MHKTPKKNTWKARFAVSSIIGIIFSLLAFNILFSEARGHLFSSLKSLRKGFEPSRRILLLEADALSVKEAGELPWRSEFLDEGVLLLSEMNAESVVFDYSIENEDNRIIGMKADLKEIFNREFTLIKNNVSTLFDAIRLGSVSPKNSVVFVNQVLSLADEGKNRLIDAMENRDGMVRTKFKKSLPSFGRIDNARLEPKPEMLLVRRTFARLGLEDADDPLGLAFLNAVLYKLGDPKITVSRKNAIFEGAVLPGKDPEDIAIPLDGEGGILVDVPLGPSSKDFRRLSCELLIRHLRLESELLGELRAMEQAGYLSYFKEEVSPLTVYDSAKGAVGLELGEWRMLRSRFFQSTARFLDGKAEGKIVEGYNVLLSSPTLTPEGRLSLLGLKYAVSNSFSRAEERLRELTELRRLLKSELEGSLCAIVPVLPGPVSRVEAAAALADAILSAHYFTMIPAAWSFTVSAVIVIAVAVTAAFLAPLWAGLFGLAALLVSVFSAGALFVLAGVWLNPLLPALSLAGTAAASVHIGAVAEARKKRSLLQTFTSRVSPESHRELSLLEEPGALDGARREASILSVRAKNIARFGEETDARNVITAYRLYHKTVGDILKKYGALLYSAEGESLFASFGFPLIRDDHRRQAALAAEAVIAAEEALSRSFESSGISYENTALCVGIDSGLCDFGDTGVSGFSGFSAYGPVAVRARVLSGLGRRYKSRILITESVKQEIPEGFYAIRLDKLVTESDRIEQNFYSLRRSGQAEDGAQDLFPFLNNLEGFCKGPDSDNFASAVFREGPVARSVVGKS